MGKNEIVIHELAIFIVAISSVYYQRYWIALFNDMYARARVPMQPLPGCQILEFRRRA